MGVCGSRAALIVTIELEQLEPVNGSVVNTIAKLQFVDCMGSERLSRTGTERFVESTTVQRSISCFGNVIQALAEKTEGKERHVPYRDSNLTRLIQHALGGNCDTTLLVTISPA